MNSPKNTLNLIGLLLAVGLAGCDQAAQTPAPEAAEPAAAAPAPAPAPALPPKVDKVQLVDLQAGWTAMQERLSSAEDAYAPIKPVANATRLFMHPLEDKDAVAEFNVSGLASVTLSPYIEDLTGSAGCSGSPDAGVVSFTYSVDDGAPVTLAVDRNYNDLVKLDLNNASKLRVAVNKGNDTITCDWASLGFVGVTNK